MIRSTTPVRKSNIAPRIQQVQARWSNEVRRERAAEGHRRRQQLFSLLSGDASEPEIWAVGAPADDDMHRLAHCAGA